MAFEPVGKLEGIGGLTLDTKREGFETLEQEEGVERALTGPEVPQPLDPRPDDEGDVAVRAFGAEGVGEDEAVVTR